jgi:hypothetical protein
MIDSKNVTIVISELAFSSKSTEFEDYPLVSLGIFLAKHSFCVTFLVYETSPFIDEECQKYFSDKNINISTVKAGLRPSVSWLNVQFQVFESLKMNHCDLVIAPARGGLLSLYASFGMNTSPLLTYLDFGTYKDKLESNTAFKQECDLIQAALEDIQLKKSAAVIPSSESTSLI